MSAAEPRLLLSCEHGGHRVPPAWRPLFAGARRQALLRSHQGFDPGALPVARALARGLGAPLVSATVTRLLVDPNRSSHNPAVFSRITRALEPDVRARLLARHHAPHWERVRAAIADATAEGRTTLHVAVHSFTPVIDGRRRDFAVGLLYDPKRRRERALAVAWQRVLARTLGAGRVRRNAPYRGDADGLTTAMRREHPPGGYLGLELELSQAWLRDAGRRRVLVRLLLRALRERTRA